MGITTGAFAASLVTVVLVFTVSRHARCNRTPIPEHSETGCFFPLEISGSAQWQSVGAVARGEYYKTPTGPYGWLSSPPVVQRYLGMLWLGELLYPEYTQYDLQEEVEEYYNLFYGCDLSDDMYQNLIADSMP